ncbi:Hypothetical protein FKW44_007148, partial [Caligus rogercresseyi]
MLIASVYLLEFKVGFLDITKQELTRNYLQAEAEELGDFPSNQLLQEPAAEEKGNFFAERPKKTDSAKQE